MDNLQSIKDLFEQWKESHNNENRESYSKTAPVDKNGNIPDYDKFKSSFCPDGYLGQQQKSNILFICKESNVDGEVATDGSFWLREVVCARLNGQKYRDADYSGNTERQKRDRTAQTKYFNCLNTIASVLLDKSENENVLQKCGYMNINKRGGYSSCNDEQLKNYAKVYDNEIFQQLQILNPRKIVLLGVSRDIFYNEVQRYLKDKKIWEYSRHPSRYRNVRKYKEEDLSLINGEVIL